MYEKIRRERNKLLYNGKPPLEAGCEIKVSPVYILEIKKNEKWIKETKEEQKRLSKIFKYKSDNWHYLRGNSPHVEAFDEILGKPVSLNDILLLLNKYNYITGKDHYHFEPKDGKLKVMLGKSKMFEIDLTKEIKNQKKETLEKIYNLIK